MVDNFDRQTWVLFGAFGGVFVTGFAGWVSGVAFLVNMVLIWVGFAFLTKRIRIVVRRGRSGADQ